MFYRLILENETGQQIDLSQTASRFMFCKIEGLNLPPGTISTSTYAGMDGSYLNNAFIEKRNVVISFQMRGIDIEKRRHLLYRVVKSSRYIKVYYKTAGIDVYTEGYVETCEINVKQLSIRLRVQFIEHDSVNVETVLGVGFSRKHLIEAVGRNIHDTLL